MRLLFATRRQHLPDRGGGAQQSVHALLRLIQARGHTCEAVAALPTGVRLTAERFGRRLAGARWGGWRDHRNGYETRRTAADLVPALVARRLHAVRPDVVVTDFFPPNDIAAVAVRCGTPTLLRMVDVMFAKNGVPIPDHPLVLPFSNSAFVAERVSAVSGRPSPIVHPIVHPERYRTDRINPAFVTLVNPITLKGLDTAVEIARLLPHRQFLFVESWPLLPPRRADLVHRLEHLPNVTLQPWALDVRPVYARTFVLIVPSQIEEAFGRVALEAQASGIPVVARDLGGLPEAIGEGGVLLAPAEPPARWAEAIERLFTDAAWYARVSHAARQNVARPDLAPSEIVDRFLSMTAAHVAACDGRRSPAPA